MEIGATAPSTPPRIGQKIELPVLVLAALLASTLIAAFQASRQQDKEAELRFAEIAAQVRADAQQRFESIRDLTRIAAEFAHAIPALDDAAWQALFARQAVGRRAPPGLVGVQWIRGDGAERSAARRDAQPAVFETRFANPPFTLPERWDRWDAVASAARAADSGDAKAVLSARLGTAEGAPADSAYHVLVAQARADSRRGGRVVALVDLGAMMASLDKADALTTHALTESGRLVHATPGRDAAAKHHLSLPLALSGHAFDLDVASTPQLEQRLSSEAPRMVLLVGLVSGALLGGLIWLLTRLRSQAESLAASMTRKLTDQTRFTEDLIEHNPNPIFRKDASGRFLSVNRAWEEFTGRPRASVLGKTYEELMPGDAARANEAHDAQLLATPDGRGTIETHLTGAGGRAFETIIAKQVVAGADGLPAGIIATITDVTQIKELERALGLQREQLNLVIRSSQQGIWDALEDGSAPPYFSDRFKEMLGYGEDDFPVPFDWKARLHPEDAPRFRQEMARLFRRESSLFDVEARVQRRDGEYLWVRARGIAQYGADGRARRFTGSITDISDRKRAEIELTEANVRVTEAARAKEAFLATMSHEMRTPLNGVLGMTSLLTETALDEEQRDYIRLIRASGDTLLRIIDDILDYSKIESGRMMLESVPVELVPLIEEAFELVAEKAREKHLALLFDFDESAPYYVLGDATRLRQILLNLLANAIKFTENGHIALTVSARPTADGRLRLEFQVEDTGIGIPSERLGRLFQPFTQVDASTTRKYGGTGLGLAICKRLTSLMGGDIRVESREGAGSTFIFTILSEEARGAKKPYMQHHVPEFAGVRLLVIEGNARRRPIQARRYRDWGLDAMVCDAAEGAWLLEQHADFDVIISDTQANNAAGDAVAKALEANDQRRVAAGRPLAVVILASMRSRAELAQGGYLPALRHDMFIVRPIGRARMFEALLRAAAGQRTFDFATRPFTRNPVSEMPREQSRVRLARTEGAERPARTVRNPHPMQLLVAEDNEVNQRVITGMLANLGHRCELVGDGKAALDAAEPGRFDAILLDVQMPVMDGIEAMRRIREKLGREACPPLIAMTAHALPGDREHYLAAGMDDYLAKPIRSGTLGDVLEAARRKRHGPSEVAPEVPADEPRVLDIEQLTDLRGLPAAPGEPQEDDGAGSLIALFREQTEQRLGIMSAKRDFEDWKGLAETAHSLRGAAASIGFPRVAAVCKDIELTARTLSGSAAGGSRVPAADATPQRIDALLGHARDKVTEANAALDAWLAANPA